MLPSFYSIKYVLYSLICVLNLTRGLYRLGFDVFRTVMTLQPKILGSWGLQSSVHGVHLHDRDGPMLLCAELHPKRHTGPLNQRRATLGSCTCYGTPQKVGESTLRLTLMRVCCGWYEIL